MLYTITLKQLQNKGSLVIFGLKQSCTSKVACNLGFIWTHSSYSNNRQQVTAVTKRAFAQVHLALQLHPFLDWEALQSHHKQINKCAQQRPILEGDWESILVQNAELQAMMGMLHQIYVTPLFCEQHWLVFGFQVQSEMLVIAYEDLQDIDPDYLNFLSLVVSIC